jgi:hypothetical protein
MSNRAPDNDLPDDLTAPKDRPRVVREDEMTQGTQVANLPHAEDEVDKAAEESFPASDPPAYSGRRDERVDPTHEASG